MSEFPDIPPPVPFDALVEAAERQRRTEKRDERDERDARDARTRELCARIMPTLDSQDARDFLNALAFMGTLVKKKTV